MNFSSTDWEQCIEEKAGKTDQNGIELVNTTSRNGRMEIWLFNIGRSVHAYLRNVPNQFRKKSSYLSSGIAGA